MGRKTTTCIAMAMHMRRKITQKVEKAEVDAEVGASKKVEETKVDAEVEKTTLAIRHITYVRASASVM